LSDNLLDAEVANTEGATDLISSGV